MKKITLITILTLSIALGYSFKTIYDLKIVSAEVNIHDGIAVFMDSTPLKEYDIIGTVKLAKITYSGDDYIEARNTLLKKCKETYPTGEGIVFFYEKYSHRYMANVITFKK